MKISRLDTVLISLPLDPPVRTAIHEIGSIHCLLLTLETDEGLTGEGHVFSFGPGGVRAVDALIDDLKPRLLGRDPAEVETLWDEIFQALNFLGQAGLTIIAMTPIDVACWDLLAKAQGKPLYQVFGGGARERIPVYASGGLWLSSGPEALATEAAGFVGAGYRALKLRIGSPTVAADVARVEAVRAAIGAEIQLMVDANQGLTVAHAIELGRELDRFELAWFEEPVPTWDHRGSAEVAAAIQTPIASGETEYLWLGLRHMVEHKSAAYLMPDLQRMGGFTEFRKVIAHLDAAGLPFTPHLFTEQSLHLMAAGASDLPAEHMPWFGALYREKLVLDADGMMAVPQAPGIGFTFDWDAIEGYRS